MRKRRAKKTRQTRRNDGLDEQRILRAIQKRARRGRQRLAACRLVRGGFHYFSRKLAH